MALAAEGLSSPGAGRVTLVRSSTMTIPYRGHTSESTYFVTSSTYCKQHLLQSERTALLFVDVLYHYRAENKVPAARIRGDA
jgi:hypothetical protein